MNILSHFSRSKHVRIYLGLVLALSDTLMVLLSYAFSLVIWDMFNKNIVFSEYTKLLPFVVIFILSFNVMGMYSIMGKNPIDELRGLVLSITFVNLGFGTVTFFMHQISVYSRGVFGLSWIFCLVGIPILRHYVRTLLCNAGYWGEPTAIIGWSQQSRSIVHNLLDRPGYGLKPVIIANYSKNKSNLKPFEGIPIVNVKLDFKKNDLGDHQSIQTAILITADTDQVFVNQFLKEGYLSFSNIILIPKRQIASLWVNPLDLGGILGFEVRQNLFSRMHTLTKRIVDLFLILITLPIILPMFLLVSLLIVIDSKGPVFYKENRIGFHGDVFQVWKFRTMIINAREMLVKYLRDNPQLVEDWDRYQKLKVDPRITRMGKILRRFSVDELPQLINVLKGEMSLVGPRPILADQIHIYGERYTLYKRVKPGMSGMWQISGRNNLPFSERAALDEYYVRNWSFWMDVYILAKTMSTIISSKGAY